MCAAVCGACQCISVLQIALPFIALTAVAWLLVVIGFGIGADTDPAEYLTVDVLVPVGDVTVAVPMLDLRRTYVLSQLILLGTWGRKILHRQAGFNARMGQRLPYSPPPPFRETLCQFN